MELIKEIGAFAGLASFLGLALLALLSFTQGRDIRRLREWAGSAPERDAERKEATSAVAAQRAEELRQLNEAHTAEREAADLREERRRRREAGLPELTRAERLQERFSGHGKWSEPLFLVALFLVALVVVGGIAYAALHGFGGNGAGKHGKAMKPAQIEVTVLNGTAVDGLASSFGAKVKREGFHLGEVGNSPSSFSESVVMFKGDNGREAHRVANALEISRVQRMTGEITSLAAGAPVAVVIGESDASSAG